MNACPRTEDLTAAYEALRAQATGRLPATTPRGLSLFLRAGLAAWMEAWTPLSPQPAPVPSVGDAVTVFHTSTEIVRLLTEMALACRQGSAA